MTHDDRPRWITRLGENRLPDTIHSCGIIGHDHTPQAPEVVPRSQCWDEHTYRMLNGHHCVSRCDCESAPGRPGAVLRQAGRRWRAK